MILINSDRDSDDNNGEDDNNSEDDNNNEDHMDDYDHGDDYLPESLKPSSIGGSIFVTSNLKHISWDETDLA